MGHNDHHLSFIKNRQINNKSTNKIYITNKKYITNDEKSIIDNKTANRKQLYNSVGYFNNFYIRNNLTISLIFILLSTYFKRIILNDIYIGFLVSQIMFIVHNISHHRELSHKAFEFTHQYLSNIFNLFGSLVTFKSGAWYALHHRKHHVICDDEQQQDPYGGYYSGKQYALVQFANEIKFNQHYDYTKYAEFNTLFHKLHSKYENVIFPFWIMIILAFSDSANLTTNLLRYCTIPIVFNVLCFFLQTLPHLYPKKIPHNGKCHPSNPWICGLLTGGEGYHGNHHENPNSSRLGRKWHQIDFGYCLIRALKMFRLVKNVIV